MSRGDWKQVPQDEWSRRLAAAQALALSYIARNGLALTEHDTTIGGLVIEADGDSAASVLWPPLAHTHAIIEATLKSLYMQQGMKSFPATSGEDFGDEIFNLEMAAVEAGFLFGLIVGSNVSPAVVAAIEAPYAPPVVTRSKKPRASGKGGAR